MNRQVQKKSILYLLILAGCLQGGCHQNSSSPADKGESITISGAFALYPMVVHWSEEFKKQHPEVRFNISAGGAGKGIADVLSGMVDIALVSRDIYPEEFERGAYLINVATDAVVPTFNANNPATSELLARGMNQVELQQIFVGGQISRWNQLEGISADYDMHIYTRSDAAGAAETWASYLETSQEDLLGIGVFGDPGQAQAILRDPLSIGFSNINFVYGLTDRKPVTGIAILPIDLNENGRVDADESFYQNLDSLNQAILDGRYPAPPSRKLGFLFRGKPESPAISAFLEYVLSESGQSLLPGNGYVRLDSTARKAELDRI